MRPLIRALGYLKHYGPTTLGAYISLIISTVMMLVSPVILRGIIDQGITARNMTLIVVLALAMVGVELIRAIFTFFQGYLSEKASQGVAYDMRNDLYARIQSLSFSYHDRAQTGQLMTRATNDVDLVRMFTGMGFLMMLSAIIMLVGSVSILFVMSWQLALVILLIMPLPIALFGWFSSQVRPLFSTIQKKVSALNIVLQENLAGVRVVQAFAREPYEAERFSQTNLELLAVNLRVGKMFSAMFPTVFLIFNLGTLAIIWFGGFQVIGGSLTLGELVAFNSYLMLVMFPIGMLGMIITMISRAAASAERIFEILDAQSEVVDRPGATPLPPIQGEVAFEAVSFRYFGVGEWVLRDVSFVARPGQTIALLGATGSGKSTIINLIPRFYDVTEGAIRIDGHDVRDVTIDSLRSQIGIVLQETTLFAGTIRQNIAFGKSEATPDEIIAAAQAAEAHDFIVEFPQGYDTPVGERGATLSGGQKQRVAIARALLLNPRILILDDSTSSVDLETEYRIQQALDTLMEGRTSFVIAQRISTVINADEILVLEKGQVVAQGNHEALLLDSPIYAEIYHTQLLGD